VRSIYLLDTILIQFPISYPNSKRTNKLMNILIAKFRSTDFKLNYGFCKSPPYYEDRANSHLWYQSEAFTRRFSVDNRERLSPVYNNAIICLVS
jgi:hypothetical protein